MDALSLHSLAGVLAFERTHRVPAGLEGLDDRTLRDIGYEPGVGWIVDVEARMLKRPDAQPTQQAARPFRVGYV